MFIECKKEDFVENLADLNIDWQLMQVGRVQAVQPYVLYPLKMFMTIMIGWLENQ